MVGWKVELNQIRNKTPWRPLLFIYIDIAMISSLLLKQKQYQIQM